MVVYRLIGAAALSSLVSSAVAGNAIIENHCGYPVGMLSTATNKQTTIAAGARYSEPMVGHQSLKITKDAKKGFSRGITQFEYTITDRLWYDISFIDCVNGKDGSNCPGWAGGVKMSATGGNCATAVCNPGEYCNKQAYFVWNDDLATKSCQPGQNKGDVIMTLCTVKKVKKSVAGRVEYEIESRDVEVVDSQNDGYEEGDEDEDEMDKLRKRDDDEEDEDDDEDEDEDEMEQLEKRDDENDDDEEEEEEEEDDDDEMDKLKKRDDEDEDEDDEEEDDEMDKLKKRDDEDDEEEDDEDEDEDELEKLKKRDDDDEDEDDDDDDDDDEEEDEMAKLKKRDDEEDGQNEDEDEDEDDEPEVANFESPEDDENVDEDEEDDE